MATRNVLFVDNDERSLKTRKEFLEEKGYRVLTATNHQDAKQVLAQERIDLAIIDIRIEDDNDCNDTSGIMLASSTVFST